TAGLAGRVDHTRAWLDFIEQTLRELPGGQAPNEPGTLPLPQQLINEVMAPIETCEHPDVRKLVCAMAVLETPPALDILQHIADTHHLMSSIDVVLEHRILLRG